MRIPENKVAEIYQAADILEVVQDFVQLKRRGTNWTGLSPFKNEKTPSFVVSPSKGIFKDFSSGKGGNVVAFLMELEGFSYPEALLYLAKGEREKACNDLSLAKILGTVPEVDQLIQEHCGGTTAPR
jgi:DNA primase